MQQKKLPTKLISKSPRLDNKIQECGVVYSHYDFPGVWAIYRVSYYDKQEEYHICMYPENNKYPVTEDFPTGHITEHTWSSPTGIGPLFNYGSLFVHEDNVFEQRTWVDKSKVLPPQQPENMKRIFGLYEAKPYWSTAIEEKRDRFIKIYDKALKSLHEEACTDIEFKSVFDLVFRGITIEKGIGVERLKKLNNNASYQRFVKKFDTLLDFGRVKEEEVNENVAWAKSIFWEYVDKRTKERRSK